MTKPFITVLLNYAQADEDGIMVLTSRQAIHETVDDYQALEAENLALKDAVFKYGNEYTKLQLKIDKLEQALELIVRLNDYNFFNLYDAAVTAKAALEVSDE